MKIMIVKFKKIHDNARLPIKGTEHAACYDVYADSIKNVSNSKVSVGLGFMTEIPVGYRGIVVPRSNLVNFNWVMNNSFGVIDSDFRGEWRAILTRIDNYSEFPYHVGDRIAQIYFEKIEDWTIEVVDELAPSNRGTGGFGSTGLK